MAKAKADRFEIGFRVFISLLLLVGALGQGVVLVMIRSAMQMNLLLLERNANWLAYSNITINVVTIVVFASIMMAFLYESVALWTVRWPSAIRDMMRLV